MPPEGGTPKREGSERSPPIVLRENPAEKSGETNCPTGREKTPRVKKTHVGTGAKGRRPS